MSREEEGEREGGEEGGYELTSTMVWFGLALLLER